MIIITANGARQANYQETKEFREDFKMTRETMVNNYHAIRYTSKALDKYFEAYGFEADHKKEIVSDPRQFAWKDVLKGMCPEAFNYIPKEDAELAQRYGSQLVQRIQSLRAINRDAEGHQTVLSKAREASRLNAESKLSSAFPSLNWIANPNMDGELGVDRVRKSYEWKHLVDIPITWSKKVYDAGISTVMAGNGMRFVMNAQERKLKRVNDAGIRAWAVVALSVKKKEATYEDAWVMSYETSDDPVLSIHSNFSKCESLLRRRIKDTVTKELLDF